jgi:predicted alpha/beta-hydrolase family hydrolase
MDFVRDGKLSGRPLLLLAHGAGAPYTSPFMMHVAKELVARDVCVVRFHFPYMEIAERTGKRKPPDKAARCIEAWREMITIGKKMRGHGPISIGGKSMGGRMASMLLAEDASDVHAAVYLGYPLHPPGRSDKLRAEHLARVPVPQLFVQGDKDELCKPELLRAVLKDIPTATHLEIPGADHSLAKSRKDPFAGAEVWLDAVAAFVRR